MKKLVAMLLVVLMALSMIACAKTETPAADAPAADAPAADAPAADAPAADEPAAEEPAADSAFDKTLTISMNVLDAEKTNVTEKDAWYREKFNIEWELIPVTWGDWTEKVRAWVAADDMPDILWWDMKTNHTAEFKTWAAAGAFREIDVTGYTELEALRAALDTDDAMMSVDGKLYGWPASRANPAWLQNAYYPMFAYRTDLAKEVGMYHENNMYTWDEVKAMIDAVKAAHPEMIGITSETWAFPGVFFEILGYGDDRNNYVLDEAGNYVPYFTTEAYRNELKFVVDLFQGGYIWKDQIVDSGSDGANHFKAGNAFMFLGNNSPSWFNGTYVGMEDVIASKDDIAPMVVLSPVDGKGFWLTQTEDYWTASHIPHNVDDEKYERILTMWDWQASEEGRIFKVAGLEGKDYEKNADGTYTILWEQNEDGSYISPYADTASNIYTPSTGVPAPNETTDMSGFNAFEDIHAFMQTSPDFHVHMLNWDIVTFAGEQYSTYGAFSTDVNAKITELIVNGGDVDAQWDAFLAEMQPKWQPVADEINAALK